VNQKAGLDKQI